MKSLIEKFDDIQTSNAPWDDPMDFASFEAGYNLAVKEREEIIEKLRMYLHQNAFMGYNGSKPEYRPLVTYIENEATKLYKELFNCDP